MHDVEQKRWVLGGVGSVHAHPDAVPLAVHADGTANIEGDATVLDKLASIMVEFDPRFPIMPGTQLRQTEVKAHNVYEMVPGIPIAE